jgi:hypothetical protein
MATIEDVLLFLIEKGQGRTEAELAIAIFGPNGKQSNVNRYCLDLWRADKVERQRDGGPGEPHTYFIPRLKVERRE